MTEDRLLSAAEAAERMGLAVQTLAKARMTGAGSIGSIPHYKIGSRCKYKLSDVLAHIESSRRTSTSDTGRMTPAELS